MAKPTKMTYANTPAQNVQAFDDRALGEIPPKVGLATATPASYTNPTAVGRPNLALQADGTDSPRETTTTKGPAKYATPGGSDRQHPANVDSYPDAVAQQVSGDAEPRGDGSFPFTGTINDPTQSGNDRSGRKDSGT